MTTVVSMNETSQRVLSAVAFAAVFTAGGLLLKFGTATVALGALIIFVFFAMAMFRNTIKLIALTVLIWGAASLLIKLPTPHQVALTVVDYLPNEFMPQKRQPIENTTDGQVTSLVRDLEALKAACERGLLTPDECSAGRRKLVDQRLTP
jgi:hypothetical protein